MIAYLNGSILEKDEDRIILLANQVGYEILVPTFVMESIKAKPPSENIALYIYYHQTERQPKPVLIGFNKQTEKEFFQLFISVADVGPLKAVKALNIPIHQIAAAIDAKDTASLKKLKGIGGRTADKIIAALGGKVDKFILEGRAEIKRNFIDQNIENQVMQVLTEQLGYKFAEAKQMIDIVLKDKKLTSPEQLLDEILNRK